MLWVTDCQLATSVGDEQSLNNGASVLRNPSFNESQADQQRSQASNVNRARFQLHVRTMTRLRTPSWSLTISGEQREDGPVPVAREDDDKTENTKQISKDLEQIMWRGPSSSCTWERWLGWERQADHQRSRANNVKTAWFQLHVRMIRLRTPSWSAKISSKQREDGLVPVARDDWWDWEGLTDQQRFRANNVKRARDAGKDD